MQSTDEYAGWAARYQRFYKESPDIVEFFKELIGRHSIRKLLDCACGPGDELLMLHSLGCDVTGSDISPAMLQLAKENMDEAGIDIPLHEVDFCQLPGHFSDAFDAVICWSGSILHVADDGEALRAFRSMWDVLSAQGIAILDQGITDCRWKEKKRFHLSRSDHDTSRVYVVDYLGHRDCRYNVLDLTHKDEKQELDVFSTEMHVLLRDDQERLLIEAGFSSVEFYGDYDFSEYDKGSSLRLIALAQK